MAEPIFSPEARASQRQKKINIDRVKRAKGSLLAWSTALVVMSIETFLLNGFFGSRLLPFLSDRLLYWLECGLVAYITSATIYLAVSMLYGTPDIFSSFLPAVKTPAPRPAYRPNLNESHMSHRSEKSWVEDIQFGTPSEKAFNSSMTSSTKSPVRSTSFNSPELLAGLISSPVGRSTPHAKPVDSIHTREQLDRYLRKESEQSFLDVSASSVLGNSFTYFNMLDMSGGERKPYQVSEKNAERTGNKENTSVLRLPTDRRVHLSPLGAAENDADALAQLRTALLAAKEPKKGTASPLLRRAESVMDRRRRSSHSSPTPQLGSHTLGESEPAGTLEEIDLSKSEHKLRAWIVKSILVPLRDQIKKVNIALEKEHANPPLRIGVSSVEALKAALTSRESLRATLLPFLLPFLSAHSNQAYLVSRITELSFDQFMVNYNWNAGGSEPEEKSISITNRPSRRPWHDALPTDAELVFSLFSIFMDYQLTSNPLVGSLALDQPFSALYTVKANCKPSAVHCAPGSFYLHMASSAPPHVDFVYVTEGGRIPMKTTITKGSVNLFYAVLHFIHHAKAQNAGKIDMVSIGRTGLGISSVLE